MQRNESQHIKTKTQISDTTNFLPRSLLQPQTKLTKLTQNFYVCSSIENDDIFPYFNVKHGNKDFDFEINV